MSKAWTLAEFDYPLPPERIAHIAAEPRDSARLLLWHNQTAQHRIFSELPDLLNPGDLLVINNSRVIPARIFAQRPPREPGKPPIKIEILLHQATGPSMTEWRVFARPGRRLKQADILTLEGGASAEVKETGAQPLLVFNLPTNQVAEYLEKHGHTPLPPYIHTQDTPDVRRRYQTVYADPQQNGSVAAPTAGLHFTPDVFHKLAQKGVKVAHVTLHVGAGTFLNPTPEQVAQKRLHHEWASLSQATANAILETKQHGGNVIAVGTTSLRTLESWARFSDCSPKGWTGSTDIFIQPGDPIRVADRLLTNFHLPQSSLLMLVSAFVGYDDMRTIYQTALTEKYRFFSFGDSSLLTKKA